MSDSPLNYLRSAGGSADIILPLTWLTLVISLLVIVVIGVLLWIGVRRASARGGAAMTTAVPIQEGERGTRWISIGVAVSAIPLLLTLVWTMVALAKVSAVTKDRKPIVLDVTPHQWWWEVQYDSREPSQIFATANEIHIPVGQPVQVRLHGADVIHSFWVPQLAGKTDAIPGRTNVTWLEARHEGRFRGQCTEFCGLQHSHMALDVVAESPAAFENWRQMQLAPAATPTTPEQERGRELVEYRCGLCHRVRGTTAGAVIAPDLTHLKTRKDIASGALPNDATSLASWIRNPQGVKPGSLMPNQNLTGPQLADTIAYLESLR